MSNVFESDAYGLNLRGYSLAPNAALETTIAVCTPEITQAILLEHPEIVNKWLQKLHMEYISKKKLCEFENDSVACFNLATFEEFEKYRKSWENGGFIRIKLSSGSSITISQKPIFVVTKAKSHVCEECGLSIPLSKTISLHYMEKHPEMIEKIIIPN